MSELVRFNVGLYPAPKIRHEAVKLSQQIAAGYRTFFTLDDADFYPHITLYGTEYPAVNRQRVIETVAVIASQETTIACPVKKLTSQYGFVQVELELTPWIKNLHETIISQLSPCRNGYIREKLKNAMASIEHGGYSDNQVSNIMRFGEADVMGLYEPHLTITRLESESDAESVIEQYKWESPVFTADSIGIFTTGEHGTCTKLVGEFKLNNK